MELKLTYIVNSNIPSERANSINVVFMSEALSIYFDFKLFIPYCGESEEDIFDYYGIKNKFNISKIKVFIPFKKELFFLTAAFLNSFLENRGDLYYVREWNALLIGMLFGKNILFEVHQIPRSPLNKIALFLAKRYSKVKFFAITDRLKSCCVKSGIPDEKIEVLPDAAPVNKGLAASDIKKKGSRPVVGYVGSMYKGRGISLIIDMARSLKGFDFVLVGGSEGDISYWRSNASDAGVGNIRFVGYVPHSKIAGYYAGFDILVMPYERKVSVYGDPESDTSDFMSPLKMFEYMASGKPIVASDLPSIREILIDGYNAVLAAPENIGEWIGALCKLANDKEFAFKLAYNAYIDIERKYSWDIRADKIFRFLKG